MKRDELSDVFSGGNLAAVVASEAGKDPGMEFVDPILRNTVRRTLSGGPMEVHQCGRPPGTRPRDGLHGNDPMTQRQTSQFKRSMQPSTPPQTKPGSKNFDIKISLGT